MPIYDYRCRTCGHEFELVVLKSTVVACPSCQAADLEQLLSGFAVSSDGIRKANALASRRAALTSRDFKDKQVAEADYIKNHND
jgi:putative FmdB family regulatory protein